MTSAFRTRLLTSSLLAGASALVASPALAQSDVPPAPIDQSTGTSTTDNESTGNEIVITGSRIARPNDTAPSPVVAVTGDQTVANADITLDTFLNTLPQVNPAGTTTSNNPGNNGQSNIDLRGLGSNRNIVLINGRRPMVSGVDQTVDLNTIPQGLIERIDVTTGGAGAAYGADAVAGVVNIIMKDHFEGVDLRVNYANSIPETDAREYQIAGTIGGNFADDRGNIAFSAEYSNRQGLIKAQRPYAAQATSTTGTPPVGKFVDQSTNPIPVSAIQALFATYNVGAAAAPTNASQIHFNNDGSVFGGGIFNSPVDVTNFRYGLDSAANPNLNFYPDFYSYNFDIVNLLVLPLERKSAFLKGNYKVSDALDFFVQGGYTDYSSSSALAPTPLSTVIKAPGQNSALQASSALISPGLFCGTVAKPAACQASGLVVPVTNPFIPADLKTLLNARTMDSKTFVGAGAAEPFQLAYRFLPTGLRQQTFRNRVLQGLAGIRGDFLDNRFHYEAYYSYGETTIDQTAAGNVNVQRAQELLEAPDGGATLCEGGFNPFGIQPLSADCVAYVDEVGRTSTTFTQKIGQAFVSGDLFELPAGPLSAVLGIEKRDFRYDFDPGALFGPIAGFNTSLPAIGTNSFLDFFGELNVPLFKDQGIFQDVSVDLTARHSKSDFNDIYNGVDGAPSNDWAYGANLTWAINDHLRLRGSYQHTVRAPNFNELFSGGGSFPQIFDPCSVGTNFRTSGGAAATEICRTAGFAGGVGDSITTFAATPGAQAGITALGNTNLKPESANTYTAGVVFNLFGFSGSVDYYNIKITDVIAPPDVNDIISACYNYRGLNSSLGADNDYCNSVFRQGGNIVGFILPPSLGGDPTTGYFQSVNQGFVKTSGIDIQLGYRLPTDFIGEGTSLAVNTLVNYLIDYKQSTFGGLVSDYAGTASYFGANLGTSFPHWRATTNVAFNLKPLTLSSRIRFIDKMRNRADVQFPGEDFSAPGTVFYFDFALEANIEKLTWRIGLNNAFNREPPIYSPNVQSGTDPSLYDVIGRRAYVSARLKF